MPKRSCKFSEDLQKEFPFLKKVCAAQDDKVKCYHCNSEFSVAHGGRSDIKDHLQSNKHNKSVACASTSSILTTFFKNVSSDGKNLDLAAKEATFAYHTANHSLSFNSNSCSSKLIAKFFEPKFSLGKTKCEAIVLNVIAPLAHVELKEQLLKANFISVSMDASNRKDIKLVPIVVRYFNTNSGIQVKLLDFKSVPGETSEILTNHLYSTLLENNLEKKVVGFCGDNCNTNFGGVNRAGTNNVFHRLKTSLGRDINGIGCGAHIVHNCVQSGIDGLPFDIEALVVKIYKYFHIYTVRVTKLKEFCEFAEIQYKKLVQHGNTRFLSMMPALERILHLFEGLKAFFSAQDMCPLLIKTLFTGEKGELYMCFVHGQLALFNKAILAMEKDNATASDVAESHKSLKKNLTERKASNFIPMTAKNIYKKLCEEDRHEVKQEFDGFYQRCIAYLDLWENSFGNAELFSWINLSQNNEVNWERAECSADIINSSLPDSELKINSDELFDEIVLAKSFLEANWEMWKNEEELNEKIISSEEKWLRLFAHFKNKHITVINLTKIVEYAFCLPGTSAPVERVFSIMNNAWTDDRGLMKESTIKGLMMCKINIGLSCEEFFNKIKNKKEVLKQVLANEKYNNM